MSRVINNNWLLKLKRWIIAFTQRCDFWRNSFYFLLKKQPEKYFLKFWFIKEFWIQILPFGNLLFSFCSYLVLYYWKSFCDFNIVATSVFSVLFFHHFEIFWTFQKWMFFRIKKIIFLPICFNNEVLVDFEILFFYSVRKVFILYVMIAEFNVEVIIIVLFFLFTRKYYHI